MYAPVFSQKTGWIVGKVESHVAKPLDSESVIRACDLLNTALNAEPQWRNYLNEKPPLGVEVIAYATNWINEDYNPSGLRIGFQNSSEDEEGEFISVCKYD